MNNHLIPTPIVDKNGKQTTVHKKLEQGGNSRSGITPPTLAGSSNVPVAESYKNRLERIRSENEQWAQGDKGPAAERAAVAIQAMNIIGNLMMTIGSDESRNGDDISDLGLSISSLAETENYEPLIIAERFSQVVGVIHDSLDAEIEWEGEDADEGEVISFDGEDTSGWQSESVSTKDVTNIIDLVYTLRDLNLISPHEVPDHGEPRFFAHLYMSTTKTINYRHDDYNTLDMIRIVDEYPERGAEIEGAINKGLHAAGIRALFQKDIKAALVSGTL